MIRPPCPRLSTGCRIASRAAWPAPTVPAWTPSRPSPFSLGPLPDCRRAVTVESPATIDWRARGSGPGAARRCTPGPHSARAGKGPDRRPREPLADPWGAGRGGQGLPARWGAAAPQASCGDAWPGPLLVYTPGHAPSPHMWTRPAGSRGERDVSTLIDPPRRTRTCRPHRRPSPTGQRAPPRSPGPAHDRCGPPQRTLVLRPGPRHGHTSRHTAS